MQNWFVVVMGVATVFVVLILLILLCYLLGILCRTKKETTQEAAPTASVPNRAELAAAISAAIAEYSDTSAIRILSIKKL